MPNEAHGHLRGRAVQLPWHSMEMDSLLSELDTDAQQGLAAEEAEKRLGIYGYNELATGREDFSLHSFH